MDVVQSIEAFKLIDGKPRFNYVKGIIWLENILHVAKWHTRKGPPRHISELYDVQRLETEDRGPKMQSDWAVVAEVQDYYIKTPSLLAYAEEANLENLICREIKTCEILRQHPHPNIAVYYGCQETRGRAAGLCFKRYTSTLANKVDPQHLNKDAFLSSDRSHVDGRIKKSLKGIQCAINHLHTLGIVHNDITPANIMFDDDGTMVLIDFDSCRPIGEELRGKEGRGTKRTHGWHDPKVTIAWKKNDLDAYAELETWLFGASADDFLFK